MKRGSFIISGIAVAAAARPAAAPAQFIPRSLQQMLNIGVNVPLSGDRAEGGREIVTGVASAIDYVNRFGGTFTSAFAMRTFDDTDALAQSMVNVQFAAADPTVIGMVGGFDGPLIGASLTTYQNSAMPLIVPGTTDDAVTSRGYRNVWRLPTKDSTEGQLAAQFAAKRYKSKLAIAISQDGDYGQGVMQGFLNGAKASKYNAIGYLFGYEHPNFDQVAKELIAKKPDFLYLCGLTSAMGPVIPALRAAGYTGPLAASQGFYNQETSAKYGDQFSNGFISTSLAPLDLAPDVAQQLQDLRTRTPVTALSAFGYAAAQILMSAVRRTGANNRLTILNALQTPFT
ncbi:MAG TPA: ABC transporter substrate-binding protein, partial [Candidatus Baltobacteraceae bacterium]|nr:ABC transporter substrate-binding protein [Candidatus Baltobacteraceae bacterium]